MPSSFYNNINTITLIAFLLYLKSIIKYKWISPLYTLLTNFTHFFYIFSYSPYPNQMYTIGWDRGSIFLHVSAGRWLSSAF